MYPEGVFDHEDQIDQVNSWVFVKKHSFCPFHDMCFQFSYALLAVRKGVFCFRWWHICY